MRRQLARILAAAVFAGGAGIATAQQSTYDLVARILTDRCVICHAGASAAADLRLDSMDGLLKGSRNGPVVSRGQPAASELIRRLRGTSQPRMPMTGPPFLSDDEIAVFEGWIASGLPAGDTAAAAPAAAPAAPRAAPAVPTYADVAPILATRCAKCHAQKGLMGPAPEGYVLTSFADTIGAKDRARIVPGSVAASELMRRIRGSARPRMPLDGPPYLSEAEMQLISRWIEAGARDAGGTPAPVPKDARVRLHGTLLPDGRLDELSLRIPAEGMRGRSVAAGTYVEVRGRIDGDGEVLVERIRAR